MQKKVQVGSSKSCFLCLITNLLSIHLQKWQKQQKVPSVHITALPSRYRKTWKSLCYCRQSHWCVNIMVFTKSSWIIIHRFIDLPMMYMLWQVFGISDFFVSKIYACIISNYLKLFVFLGAILIRSPQFAQYIGHFLKARPKFP